jgi:hypothetical protein
VDVSDMSTTSAEKYISEVESKFKENVTDRTVVVTSNRVQINCSHNE